MCECKHGFSGNGIQCSGKRVKLHKSALVVDHSVLSIYYIILHTYNTDINECARSQHNCHQNALCRNSQGSYECTCRRGFSGNGIQCFGRSIVLAITRDVVGCIPTNTDD